MIKFNNYDLRYYVNVDYREYHACQHGSDCCYNDYCRCGRIENAAVNSFWYSWEVVQQYFKEFDVLTQYCIERLIANAGWYNSDNYDITIYGGYYGQEIGSVLFTGSLSLDNKIEEMLLLSDKQKVEYILEEEYGYILDSLLGMNYSVEQISKSDIFIGNENYSRKLDKVRLSMYTEYSLPLGIARRDGEKYRLVDGYHRVAANKKDKISIIVGSPQ